MGGLGRDLYHGVRRMRRDGLVTAVAVLSLGAAIGGNAAVFSMIDAFIFRPLPYDAPERVVLVSERRTDQPPLQGNLRVSLPTWGDLARRSRTATVWGAFDSRLLTLRGEERSDAVQGAAVTEDFFRVLGVRPERGRLFSPEETVEGGPAVVVLSHEFRTDRFAPDEDPLGAILVVAGEPREVIGVLPEGFQFLFPRLDLWIPLTTPLAEAERDERSLIAVARMAPGATTDEVAGEMTALAATVAADHPATNRGWTLDTYNLRHDIPTSQTRALFGLLQGSVALVLLIACANIANLLLARGQQRGREIALRTVLGADRARIVRQLLTESAVMVALGGAVGIGVAWLGVHWISGNFAGVLPPGFEPRLDGRVLAVTGGISMGAMLLAGLVPAFQTFRRGQAAALGGGARAGSSRNRKAVSRILVVAEIALSFVALGGGSLLVRSFLELQSGDPGFGAEHLLTATVAYPPEKVPTPEERNAFHRRLLERARAVPAVQEASMADNLPRAFGATTDSLRLAGEAAGSEEAPRVTRIGATDGYVETLGLTLVRGRFFQARDDLDGAAVAVVSESLARSRWGTEDPVGRRIRLGDDEREVVGVVNDVEPLIRGATVGAEAVYVPVAQSERGASVLLVRTRGTPERAVDPLRRALRELDPDLSLARVQSYEAFLDQAFAGIRVFNVILGGFGAMALLLASVGTWGVLAYSVVQRRREIGIRMAVGAEARSVVWIFFRQGALLGLLGLAVGLLLTLPLVGVVRGLLASIAPVEPMTLAGIAALLLTVTLAAGFLPARGAAAIDPVKTLREE